jgi:hypothetical protein
LEPHLPACKSFQKGFNKMQLDPLHLDAGPESGCKAALKRDQLREHSGAPGKMHAIAALCLKYNPAPARPNLRSSAAALTHASSLPCAVAACMLATERAEWRMALRHFAAIASSSSSI